MEGFVLEGVVESFVEHVPEQQFADWTPATPADALAAREYFAKGELAFERLHCGVCLSGIVCETQKELRAALEAVRAERRALGADRFAARLCTGALSGAEFWKVADRVASDWDRDGH